MCEQSEPASRGAERPAATDPAAPPSASRIATPSILLALGLAVVLIGYAAHCAYFWAYVNDDAYITFRYSRFLWLGRGPYFNIGEHVEGYSNFLLMLLLTPIIGLFGESSAAPFAKLLGVACGGLAIVAVGLLVRRVDRDVEDPMTRGTIAAILAAGLVAVSPTYALNGTSGLETMMFAGCLALGLLLGEVSREKGRWRGAGIAFACATLTRPEGILFFTVYWLAQLLVSRKAMIEFLKALGRRRWATWPSHRFVTSVLVVDAMIVAGVFLAHLAFRRIAYDGEWLPNTYYAKAGGFWSISATSYIADGILRSFFDPYGISVGIGLLGWLLSGVTRRNSFPLFCTAATGALLPYVTGTDWMLGWRLLMPFLPAVAAILAIGWCRVAAFAVRKPRGLGPATVLLCIPLLWFMNAEDRRYFHDFIQERAGGYEKGHMALADWLRSGAARKGDTVALMDIGIVGYLCIDQNILDTTGLTDRTIAKSPGTFLNKHYDPAYVIERKPEFIVLVFSAAGNPHVPPPDGTAFWPGNPTEANLWNNAEFKTHYVRRRSLPEGDMDWTERMARGIGAERIFLHAHPGQYYVLAVFRRLETAAPPTQLDQQAPRDDAPRRSSDSRR